jgi:CubicO group peptidase (beta-lactamase class C family)
MTIGTRVREVMSAHIEAGDVPGAVWEVSGPDGIDRGWAGTFAPDGEGPPVGPDTVFRLSSTTKPIIAALAMTLVDDGTLSLDQPVDEVLPELANRRVMVDPNGSLTDTVPAERPITVADVLEFRLGIGMDFTAPWPNPIMTAAEAAGLAMGPPAPQSNPEPDEWMRRLGTLPLVYQPGEKWLYHTGASVLGVLIARAAAQPLEDVLSKRLLTPLGMKATGFGVPAQQRGMLGPLWMPPPRVRERRSWTRPTVSGPRRLPSPTPAMVWSPPSATSRPLPRCSATVGRRAGSGCSVPKRSGR